nr:probable glucan 1,3-beta-glucosidase A [Ipomoea batatas]
MKPNYVFILVCCILSISQATVAAPAASNGFRVRAVNLGGWLVTEGWMKPSLFDAIPNRDLLDGSRVQFKSVILGKYLSAEHGGGTILVANKNVAMSSETFKLWRINETTFNFRVHNNQFVGLDTTDGVNLVAVENTPCISETFMILRNSDDPNRVRIKASNGFFLQVKTGELVNADSKGNERWDDDDPSIFIMTTFSAFDGEYQITNGYGPVMAPKVMRVRFRRRKLAEQVVAHIASVRSSIEALDFPDPVAPLPPPPLFPLIPDNGAGGAADTVGDPFEIGFGLGFRLEKSKGNSTSLEEDFKWISNNGLNAVRIPLGWWIAYDPNPPKPFVGGSLKALDNAFKWATKYGLKVLLELHAAPGSQNGFALSASRDGTTGWGIDSISPTVAVIEFLAARYAKNPSLYSIGLMNEPSLWISPEAVMSYYRAGYDAVRRHSSTAYVVMATRMGALNVTELLPFAAQFERAVLDVHLYNFDHLTVHDTINDVYTHCREVVSAVTTSNGPLSFVAEWTGEWMVPNATKEEYQRFVKAQLEVFDRATFGWAYWTLKHVGNHWSLEWMIKNGYINLTASNPISVSSI